MQSASKIEPWLAIATTLLAGAKKPHGTTQNLWGRQLPMDVVTANHAPAPSLAAACGGWMSENFFLASEGKSVFS
jgi:hypothetical protein